MRHINLRVLVLVIILVGWLGMRLLTVGVGSAASGWLATAEPTLIKQFDLAAGETFPTTVAGLGNRDCSEQTVLVRPSSLLQSAQSTSACFVGTAFGLAESNGLIRFDSARLAGQTSNFAGYLPGLIAIPNSHDIIHYTSAGNNGLFLHFTRNLPGPLSVTPNLDGNVSYRFTQAANPSLRDQAGNLLPAQTDSLAFSANGRWMVVDSPGRALLRVNIETLEVLPFAPAFSYSVSPNLQTAISNDGRLVAVASRPYASFKVFDLSTCANQAVPAVIIGPLSCQSRDVWPFMQAQVAGFGGVFNLRFKSNTILSLFTVKTVNGINIRSRFSLLAPGETAEKISYLAMGDSFASGEGDMQGAVFYEVGSDTESNKCHLSRRSYPYLLAASTNGLIYKSSACSGAQRTHISEQPQYPSNVSSWLAGSRPQNDWVELLKPNYLTLSIGGNDVGFADVLAECITSRLKIPIPTTCRQAANPTDRANFAKLIADQYFRLKETYTSIIQASNHRAKIYVVGYPEFVKAEGGSCGLNVPLNDQERLFVSKSTLYLNQVIKAAAESSGLHYLELGQSLSNHNLCSLIDDSQMAVNGLTEGDDSQTPWWLSRALSGSSRLRLLTEIGLGNESFHPNANGHQLMSNAILSLTDGDLGGFPVCQPANILVCPKASPIPSPDVNYFGQAAVDYVSQLNISSTALSPPTPRAMLSTTTAPNSGLLNLSLLKPNSPVQLTLSDGQILGNFQTDAGGKLTANFSWPAQISGTQRITAVGTNLAAEPVTYFQTIFLLGPDGDRNGNGQPDEVDRCGFVPSAGFDSDHDGFDDACDGNIGSDRFLTLDVRSMSAH